MLRNSTTNCLLIYHVSDLPFLFSPSFPWLTSEFGRLTLDIVCNLCQHFQNMARYFRKRCCVNSASCCWTKGSRGGGGRVMTNTVSELRAPYYAGYFRSNIRPEINFCHLQTVWLQAYHRNWYWQGRIFLHGIYLNRKKKRRLKNWQYIFNLFNKMYIYTYCIPINVTSI